MAEKLGLLNQWIFGDFAERATINRNAEHLSNVEAGVADLRALVQRQAQDMLRLRAMFMGLVEVLQAKGALAEADLEAAMQTAWEKLVPPPPTKPAPGSDPYRSMPVDPSPEEIEAAKALLASAQGHHFSKRFQEARDIYQQIVEKHGNTKQATTARQQLENLGKR